jgi:hypothetical protein
MRHEDGVLLGLEGKQRVVAFDLGFVERLSDLYKIIRHS